MQGRRGSRGRGGRGRGEESRATTLVMRTSAEISIEESQARTDEVQNNGGRGNHQQQPREEEKDANQGGSAEEEEGKEVRDELKHLKT